MKTSKMDIRAYKPADETFYDYKDEEEIPRGIHHKKEDDEDINNSTVGRYASGENFKHWPFKVGNAMTHNIPDGVHGFFHLKKHSGSTIDQCSYTNDQGDPIIVLVATFVNIDFSSSILLYLLPNNS